MGFVLASLREICACLAGITLQISPQRVVEICSFAVRKADFLIRTCVSLANANWPSVASYLDGIFAAITSL